jgi:hypothetical protein
MGRRLPPWLLGACALALFPPPASAAEPPPDRRAALEHFEKKVRPLLVEHCHSCHSVGKKKRGGLLLDSRAALLRGGDNGPAVAPGDPDRSRLVRAVRYRDDLRMPPRSKLPDAAIADLELWVRQGAVWPDGGAKLVGGKEGIDFEKRRRHWSFQPLAAARPPAVKDGAWAHTPVDNFILAKLEAKGLRPAALAERRTLLRRVTFDLTGLPPTPAETDAFLADGLPGAYERVVDRLLASPAYGERWGRHWLDLVRFAETSGHEFDFEIPEAHRYRDYVIRALNADVPYDQLLREHVAGDLLPAPRRHLTERFNESVLGTGFWFLGESKHSPVDLRGDGADRRDNQVDVFAKTFLGLTVSCARCHDHKFDPIYTKDYYSLVSYLQSSRMQRAFLDHPEVLGRPAARLAELRRQAAVLAVARAARSLEEGLSKGLPRVARPLPEDHLLAPYQALTAAVKTPEQFAARRREIVEGHRARAKRAAEAMKGYVPFDGFRARGYRDWFVTGHAFGTAPTAPGDVELGPDGAVRRVLPGGVAHGGRVSGRLQGALRSRTFTIEKRFILYRASGRGVRVNVIIDGFQQIRDPIYGGLTFGLNADRPRWFVQNVGMWVGQRAYLELLDDGDGHAALEQVLFSDSPAPPPGAPSAVLTRLLDDPALTADGLARKYRALAGELVADWRAGKLDDERVRLLNDLLEASRERERPEKRLSDLLAQARSLEATLPAPRRGLALADGTGVNERVHTRGNHRTLGEEAPRRLLVVLAGEGQPLPREGSGRLELADRLVHESRHLVARVMVNRLWQHSFGQGLVRSPDDFGFQGERPTHPELLDWLAAELVRQGWSLKAVHRLLLLSSTYRMSSRAEPGAALADPRNELWHRAAVRRLEAEAIRDSMLAISGRLDRRMYGRGPLPHLTEFMVGRGRPGSGPLDGDGRRSLYLQVRRNFLNPMFLAFDYPIPFSTMGRRSVSNVPAQALTLLNNPFVTQQARLWAERVLAEPGLTDRQRIERMYVSAFGRPATAEEAADALAFLAEQEREHGRGQGARAWADLAHVLFNVKELIFIN